MIAVDSDVFFIAKENKITFTELSKMNPRIFYHEIKSVHGHDAFLIEFDQLNSIIKPIFNSEKNNF